MFCLGSVVISKTVFIEVLFNPYSVRHNIFRVFLTKSNIIVFNKLK